MKLKPLLITLLCVLSINISNAQVPSKYSDHLVDYQEITIDINEFRSLLQNIQMRNSVLQNKSSNTIIQLPIPTGGVQQFRVVESPILSPDLSASRPDVKSYIAKGIDDPTSTARFNITSAGFYGIIKSVHGISIIEKIDTNRYITYYDHNIINTNNNYECETDDTESFSTNAIEPRLDSCFQIGDNLRSYELVLTCSGEFYALNGGTDPLVEAALLNRITQINTVYETEIATTFTIVEFLLNNNAATDPFSDPTNTSTSLTEAENYINANVTASSWDIGHGFHEITCGGGCGWAGRAGLAVVCTSAKARGYTYLPNDIPTAITVLVHEFGHQFSNGHTNYGCNSNNACSRYEPGQGSTIMSTGAGCDAGDFFASRTDYFSVVSLQNMVDFMNSGLFVTGTSCGTVSIGGWSDCATLIPTGNNMPSSNANANNINGLVIPHSTPFVLSGSGSDADGLGSLTYNWEQYDTDYSGSDAPDDTGASTTAPLFRSFPPSTNSERTVPVLSSILAGNVTTGTGEVLPTVARNLTWRLTVRDNEIGGGGVACDQIALSVGSDGPFQITSQNSTTAWFAGNTETITWDVANTNSPMYTCSNVDIVYSSDGGNTFPTTLASGIPNNGSFNITVPGLATNSGRVKIMCTGGTNIFFDINNIDISIVSSCAPVGGTIANSDAVTADEGSSSLDLNLLSGLPVTSVSGVLDASDSNSNLTVENNSSGTCISFGNNPKYETIELASGSNSSVTFNRTSQGDYNSMIGLFENSYNPSSVCDNWLNSNGNFNGTSSVNIGVGFTESLTTGTTYVLLASGFSTATPSVGNYNVSFSQTLYDVGALNVPGYIYTYVIVNNTSGNIVAFDAGTDLSNGSIYTPGSYTIYGLSYLASETLGTYVGGPFSSFQSDISSTTVCGEFSSNNVPVTITGTGPTTYTYNGTWSPSDPNGVSTASEDIIIVSGNATINSNTACNSLTVNAGAGLTINSSIALTISNGLNLESNSTSYSSLILDGSVTGTINYERHVNINGSGLTGSNDLISAPLTGQAFNVFAAANPNILSNTGATLYLFGPFDKTTGAYVTYSNTETATLDPGVGYRAASNDNSTFTFTGTANNGTVSYDIINSGPTEPEWNLVGNPYPSYLNVQAFLNHEVSTGVTNLNLMNAGTAAIYGYDGNALDDWTIYNLANTTASTVIAPGQGFFVSADPTNVPLHDLEFTPAMRSTGTSDDFIVGRSANSSNSALSKLILSSPTKTTNTSIYFIEGTTRGLDPGYDASAYKGTAGGFSIFTNLIEDNEGKDIAIQSIPFNDFNNVIIPLGIKALAGTSLTISINNDASIPSHINVYLEDIVENKLTLLNDSDYNFIPSNDLTGVGRFFLRYSADTISEPNSELEHVLIYHNNSNKQVIIKGYLASASNVMLFDIHGRMVLNKDLDTSNSLNTINVDGISTGVYIVQLSNDNSTITQKLVIQ